MDKQYHVLLRELPQGDKNKYQVYIIDSYDETIKRVKFGAQGYEDYTTHLDEERKMRYLQRHYKNENWSDIFTAGFWSRWLLWNKPTIDQSKKDISNKFDVNFIETF